MIAIAMACGVVACAPRPGAPASPSVIVLDVGAANAAPAAPSAIVHHPWESPRLLDPAGVSTSPDDTAPALAPPGVPVLAASERLAAVRQAARDLRDPALDQRADADDVLWHSGAVLAQGRYMKEARAVFLRLLKDYPQSPHVPDAYVLFGDYYLGMGQLADAREFYAKAATFPRAPAAAYARVQLARVTLAEGNVQDALAAFVAQAGDPSVREAALAGAVDAYAQVGRPGEARAFFERIDRDGAIAEVERLGRAYLALGKRDDALAVLRGAVANDPDAARRCRARAIAVRVLREAGASRELLLDEVAALAAAITDGCRGEADLAAGDLATAWTAELSHGTNDPAQVERAWAIAAQLATTPRRRAAAARDRAIVAWELAERAERVRHAPEAWLAAAAAADAAVALDPSARDLAQRAADARHNARITAGP